MLRSIAIALATSFVLSGLAVADASDRAPLRLTAEQMENITAAGYGKTIIEVTGGASFGQLIGPAKKAGTAAHDNYAGGAKALVETVCVHLPSTPGC